MEHFKDCSPNLLHDLKTFPPMDFGDVVCQIVGNIYIFLQPLFNEHNIGICISSMETILIKDEIS